jgi:hypothetical protein
MKKIFLLFGSGLLCIMMLVHCNPSCDTPYSLEVSSLVNQVGSEVLLRSSNPSFLNQLDGRSVFINNSEVSPSDIKFYPDFGLVVKTPATLQGDINVSIEDADCGTLGVNLSMMDESFFINNPDFIVPGPPAVVIPVVPPVFPNDITNAWISPQNPDYCLWFGPYKTYQFEVDGEVLFEYSTNVIAAGSFELSACGNTDAYYHNNPFFGVVDTVENYIEVTIDRTAKGKDVNKLSRETFTGQFIDLEATNYGRGPTNPCEQNGDTEKKVHMIWLVSKQTGRQLILYKLINP